MKKYLVFSLALVGVSAFAQDVAPPDLAWLDPILNFLANVPKVGPVIVMILKWVGAIAAGATALSVCVTSILKIPELASRWLGLNALADKIVAVHAKIKPWVDYLSIFNSKLGQKQ